MIRLRILDWAAIALSVLVVGAFSWYAYARSDEEPMLYIQGEHDSWVYPLEKNRELHIPGPLGETHVIIRDGMAYVEDSPCRDKICIYLGKISRLGDWVACLPNRVFLRIEGKGEAEVDATVF